MKTSALEILVEEVYAEHEGRTAPKPRHAPASRCDWAGLSTEVATTLAKADKDRAARTRAAELALDSDFTGIRIDVAAHIGSRTKQVAHRVARVFTR